MMLVWDRWNAWNVSASPLSSALGAGDFGEVVDEGALQRRLQEWILSWETDPLLQGNGSSAALLPAAGLFLLLVLLEAALSQDIPAPPRNGKKQASLLLGLEFCTVVVLGGFTVLVVQPIRGKLESAIPELAELHLLPWKQAELLTAGGVFRRRRIGLQTAAVSPRR